MLIFASPCENLRRRSPARANFRAQLEQAEEKLADAKSAGKLKRLVRGLNPVKLQVVVANLKTELAVVQSSMAAAASNQAEILVAMDRARKNNSVALTKRKLFFLNIILMLAVCLLASASSPSRLRNRLRKSERLKRSLKNYWRRFCAMQRSSLQA